MPPQIVIDDASAGLTYIGTQWTVNKGVASAYNQTITICNTNNSTTKPEFSVLFYGSELALYGPPNGDNVRLSYVIDGSSRRSAQLSKSSSPSQQGLKLWSLDNMDTTYHDITFYPEDGIFSYDSLVITPNKYSSLSGRRLVVDDSDSQIQYSSNSEWTVPNNGTMESIINQGIPFGGGLKGTNSVNANMTFSFTGSSVSVFGLLNQQAGRLSFSFSVDNSDPEIVTPFDGTQTANNAWRLNQEFFRKDLGPGNHSVALKVLEVTDSQMLWLDYVVFEGSSATTLTPSPTGGNPSSPTSTSSSRSPLTTSQISGIVIISLILLFFCCFGQKCLEITRRRRERSRNSGDFSTSTYPSDSYDRPIIVVVPPSNQPSAIIHNHTYPGTMSTTIQNTNPALPPYQPQTPQTSQTQTTPIRDAGPADAPPPYNPNAYIP
ncbi:hypothetical protein BJ165DRAFT_1524674 [Panaeolus papilionaceus]|nr:hypothetical protein BJ165DRAFT_1524674 [Panaeolus papilionaceus]